MCLSRHTGSTSARPREPAGQVRQVMGMLAFRRTCAHLPWYGVPWAWVGLGLQSLRGQGGHTTRAFFPILFPFCCLKIFDQNSSKVLQLERAVPSACSHSSGGLVRAGQAWPLRGPAGVLAELTCSALRSLLPASGSLGSSPSPPHPQDKPQRSPAPPSPLCPQTASAGCWADHRSSPVSGTPLPGSPPFVTRSLCSSSQ